MISLRPRLFVAGSILGLSLVALAVPLRGVVANIVTTDIYLVEPNIVATEDAYVVAATARVEGTLEGDLVVTASRIDIPGKVDGDVLVLSAGTLDISGEVTGSVRGVVRELSIEGRVGDDVAVAAATTRISGSVGRDVIVLGTSLDISGEVERDVRGRILNAIIDGHVGNDVDIAVGGLTLGNSAVVDGDVLYRSDRAADVSITARVGSQLERLPVRGSFAVEVVLILANLLGFFGFLVAGILLIWLFRKTAPRAVTIVVEHPIRATAVGVATVVVLPAAILLLAATLVGAPVAIALLLLLGLGLIFGPIPAVAAIGVKLLRGRAGLFAGFVVGAIVWRLGIWLVPFIGFVIYLGALAAGVGGWIMSTWRTRAEGPTPTKLVAPPHRQPAPADWQPPLPPSP